MASLFPMPGQDRKSVTPLTPVEPAQTGLVSTNDYVFGAATPLLAALLPESAERQVQTRKELQTAGYYQPHAVENLAAIRYLAIIVPLLVLGGLLLVVPARWERPVLISMLIIPPAAWALPRLMIKRRGADRVYKIENALPDMLDMLNMCVSQGMTVPAALARVGKEIAQPHPALQKELQIVSEQAQLGSLRQALENFSRRIDIAEVHSFTSLLIQTERMGTSVSDALVDYSENIREGLKQRAEEKGNRAAFKLLFPTVLCLMPSVFMILLGPAVVEFSKFMNREDRTMERANDVIRRTGTQFRFGDGDQGGTP